jgi:RHS repeat-associated protein
VLADTYQFGHTYSGTTGLLVKDSYPAVGGLPAETVTHGYAGVLDLPDTLAGLAGYAQGVTHDAFGRVNQETIGADTNLAYLTNGYDAHTGHLTDQLLTRQVATPTKVDEQAYSYDPAGNITRQDSTRLGAAAPSETQCARYDQLDRLTMAWTATDSCAAVPAAGNSGTVGDGLGPASAYWTQWSYDAVGDRTAQTEHPGGAATGTTTTYTYGRGTAQTGIAQPHTLTSTSAGGSYGYDAAGEMTSRNGQTLTWNDARQLVAASNGSSYVYDASGALLLQKDPGSTTLYLPGEQLVLNTGAGSATGTRYYPLPGGGIAVRTGAAKASYQFELTDQHGTPTVYLDSTAQQPSWRQSTPYGQPRGAAVTSPDNHGFLGKPTDAGTGLVFVGAREYDPDTGRFISPDPVFEADDPQSLNGYSYAAGNPVTKSDPTGLRPCGDVGCDGYQGNGKPVTPDKKQAYHAPPEHRSDGYGDRCGRCGSRPKWHPPMARHKWQPGDDDASSRNCMAYPAGSAFSSPGACDDAYAAADQTYENELALQRFGWSTCPGSPDANGKVWYGPCRPHYPDVAQVPAGANTKKLPPPASVQAWPKNAPPGAAPYVPSPKDGGISVSFCSGASLAAMIFVAGGECYGFDKHGFGRQDTVGGGFGESIALAATGGISIANGSLSDVAGWDACGDFGGTLMGVDAGVSSCTNTQTTSISAQAGPALGMGGNFGYSSMYTTPPEYWFYWPQQGHRID